MDAKRTLAIPTFVAVTVCLALAVAVVAFASPALAHDAQFQFPTPAPATKTSVPPTEAPTAQPNTPVPPTQPPATPQKPKPGGKSEKEGPSGVQLVPPGVPPAKFKIGSCAQVVRPSGLDLFTGVGFDSGYLIGVPVSQQVRVLAGPVGADNLWWWQFRSPDGKNGWGVSDYAEPSAGPCVGGGSVLSLGSLPLTGAGMGWLIPGVVLALILIVAAVLRRRQTNGK